MKLLADARRILISASVLLLGGSVLACTDNPWYPTVAGATWTYSMAGDTFTQSIVEVSADSMTVRMEMPGQEPFEVSYGCGPDGILSAGFFDGIMEGVEFEMVSMEGTTFPNDLTAGTQWDSEIVMSMEMVVEGMSVDSLTTVTTDSSAVGLESVTVPAGTFDAMRINQASDITMEMVMMGMSVPLPAVSSASDTWLAEGVGMVLIVDQDGTRTELISYSVP